MRNKTIYLYINNDIILNNIKKYIKKNNFAAENNKNDDRNDDKDGDKNNDKDSEINTFKRIKHMDVLQSQTPIKNNTIMYFSSPINSPLQSRRNLFQR